MHPIRIGAISVTLTLALFSLPQAHAAATAPAPTATETTASDPAPSPRQGSEAPTESPGVVVSAAPGSGATIRSGDDFSLNVRSRFQLRHSLEIPPKGDDGERDVLQNINVNTARLWLSGLVYRPELTYMLQLAFAGRDFRDGATSPIFDAYLDWKAHRDVNVRAGQFFVPFDRLRTVREFALQMAERPRPVAELTLDRDVGVVVYSERFLHDASPVAIRIGAFGGGGTNQTAGKELGGLFVGRVEVRPFGPLDDDSEGDLERRLEPRLALGAGAALNVNSNRQRSTTGPTFAGGTTDHTHLAADLVFKWRGLALQGEYLWKNASADSLTSEDATGAELVEYTRSGQGWVAQASYVFDPPIELVGRFAVLSASSGTDPSFVSEADARGRELGGGLNYYLNGHKLKLQSSWIARTGEDLDLKEAVHGVFTQIDATF